MKIYNCFVPHGVNQTLDGMSTLKFKNSVLKKYNILDWNEEDEFFLRSLSVKIHIGTLQKY